MGFLFVKDTPTPFSNISDLWPVVAPPLPLRIPSWLSVATAVAVFFLPHIKNHRDSVWAGRLSFSGSRGRRDESKLQAIRVLQKGWQKEFSPCLFWATFLMLSPLFVTFLQTSFFSRVKFWAAGDFIRAVPCEFGENSWHMSWLLGLAELLPFFHT